MLLALLLCYAGWAGLSLSMDRHFLHVSRRLATARRRLGLRLGGWLLLGASLWAALSGHVLGVGLVQWSALLMFSALAWVLLLPYRPRLAVWVAGLGLLASPAVAMVSL